MGLDERTAMYLEQGGVQADPAQRQAPGTGTEAGAPAPFGATAVDQERQPSSSRSAASFTYEAPGFESQAGMQTSTSLSRQLHTEGRAGFSGGEEPDGGHSAGPTLQFVEDMSGQSEPVTLLQPRRPPPPVPGARSQEAGDLEIKGSGRANDIFGGPTAAAAEQDMASAGSRDQEGAVSNHGMQMWQGGEDMPSQATPSQVT